MQLKTTIDLFSSAEAWPMGVGIFCLAVSSTERQSHLNLATFNCRSVKSSVSEVKQLCDS